MVGFVPGFFLAKAGYLWDCACLGSTLVNCGGIVVTWPLLMISEITFGYLQVAPFGKSYMRYTASTLR